MLHVILAAASHCQHPANWDTGPALCHASDKTAAFFHGNTGLGLVVLAGIAGGLWEWFLRPGSPAKTAPKKKGK